MCRWLMCVCLLGLIQSPVATAFFVPTPGKIKTEHTLYYVGENITLHCFKKTGSFDDGANFTAGNELVPHQYVTVVNDTYIRMDRPATAEDKKSITFTCADNNTPFIAAQVISTEYRPQEVENLIPVFYDRRTALFSWGLGVEAYKYRSDTQNSNNPTTVITAHFNTDGTNWMECLPVNGTSTETSCQVENFMAGAIPIELRVRVENKKRGDVVNTTFSKIRMNDYEKPKAVEKLTVDALNSTCVTLAWKMDSSELHAVIKYEHSFSNQSKEVTVKEDGENATVCDLHPAYNYSFEVCAVPKPTSGYPSEPVTAVIKMPEDVPVSAPRVSKGGYRRGECAQDPHLQDLYVYFQPVLENDQNGDIKRYSVKYEGEGWTDGNSRSPADGLHFRRRVPCGSEVNITLYANTSVGQSPPAYLHIPPSLEVDSMSQDVRHLDLMVDVKNQTQVVAHWKPLTRSPDYSIFLYYCYRMESPGDDCKHPLEYVKVNATEGRYVLDTTNPKFENGKYGFAAVDGDGRGTGIVFTDCVYTVSGDHEPAPAKPNDPFLEVGAITLSWHATRCDGKRVLYGFVIRKCPVGHEDKCNDIVVEGGSTNKYRLEVEPGTNYSLSLAANTSSSPNLTDFSPPVYGQALHENKIKPEEIVGIAIAVLLFVLICGCCAFTRIRSYCRKRKEKFNWDEKKNTIMPRYARPPTLPPRNLNLYENMKGGSTGQQSQGSSNDSGKGTTPPNSPGDDKTENNNMQWMQDVVTVEGAQNRPPGYMRVEQPSAQGSEARDGFTPDASITHVTVGFASAPGPNMSLAQNHVAESQVSVGEISTSGGSIQEYVKLNTLSTLQALYVGGNNAQELQAARHGTRTTHLVPPGPEGPTRRDHSEDKMSPDQKAKVTPYVQIQDHDGPPAHNPNPTYLSNGCAEATPPAHNPNPTYLSNGCAEDGPPANNPNPTYLSNGCAEATPPAHNPNPTYLSNGCAEDGPPAHNPNPTYLSNGCTEATPPAHNPNPTYLSNGCAEDRPPAHNPAYLSNGCLQDNMPADNTNAAYLSNDCSRDRAPADSTSPSYLFNGCAQDEPPAHNQNTWYVSNGCQRGPSDVNLEQSSDDDDDVKQSTIICDAGGLPAPTVASPAYISHANPSTVGQELSSPVCKTEATSQHETDDNPDAGGAGLTHTDTDSGSSGVGEGTQCKAVGNGYLPHSVVSDTCTPQQEKMDWREDKPWTNDSAGLEPREEALTGVDHMVTVNQENHDGGSSEHPDDGGSSEHPDDGGSSERPDDGGSSERPDNGGSSERPDNGGSSEHPDDRGAQLPAHKYNTHGNSVALGAGQKMQQAHCKLNATYISRGGEEAVKGSGSDDDVSYTDLLETSEDRKHRPKIKRCDSGYSEGDSQPGSWSPTTDTVFEHGEEQGLSRSVNVRL